MSHNHGNHHHDHVHASAPNVSAENELDSLLTDPSSSTSTGSPVVNQPLHGMTMSMVFHGGINETILFSFWNTNSDLWIFMVSWLIIFIISFIYEGLKFYREKLYKDSLRRVSVSRGSDSSGARIPVMTGEGDTEPDRLSGDSVPMRFYVFNSTHFLQTVLHMVQIVLSYTLMLIFMTFNIWLCLAVTLGAGLGYLIFGWKRAIVGFDVTEHCQ